MKKSLLLVGLISGLGIAGLASCGIKKDNVTNELSRSETLSMQAATSLSMVNNFANSKSGLLKSNKVEDNAGLTEAEKAEIKEIIPTLDLMLSNSSSFDSTVENGEFKPVSDDETIKFNTKEVIGFLGTDGKTNSYTLYYDVEIAEPENPTPEDNKDTTTPEESTTPEDNKDTTTPDENTTPEDNKDTTTPDESTTPEENTEPTTPEVDPTPDTNTNVEPKKANDDEEEDEEENEIKFEDKISGLAFIDDSSYFPFESEVSKEIEGDETEDERTFKITTFENSYIEVKQEHEVEGNEVETEFKYTVVENGELTLEYSIEIENEDDQLEIGYEIGGKEYELVKEEKDGEVIYHVEYENDATDVEALISFRKITDEETGEVSYEEII